MPVDTDDPAAVHAAWRADVSACPHGTGRAVAAARCCGRLRSALRAGQLERFYALLVAERDA